MLLKSLVPLSLLTMVICMSCSSTSPPPQPPNDAQIAEPASAAETEATWGDDMTYSYLFERDADTKTAMAVIKATLDTRQKAYIRDRVGNLVFAEIITLSDPGFVHSRETHQNVAVILGEKPRLVSLPDKALFAHFAKNIRPNPDVIDAGNRIWTALILSTGMGHTVHEPTPATWTDKDGTLVIHCFRYITDDNGRIYDMLQECTLTVDTNQDYTLECIDDDE